jgi:uncharacterized membrane protein
MGDRVRDEARAVVAALRWWAGGPIAATGAFVLIGGALYLLGTILVTIVFNVPRNDALGAIDAASLNGARLWDDYLISGTARNQVRTAAALAAAASLTTALCSLGDGGLLAAFNARGCWRHENPRHR